MKYTVQNFTDKFRAFVGDSSIDITEPFIIEALNWAFNELPRVPKLNRIFSKHYTLNLDAKEHYKWKLNQDFRRISDMPFLNFWTSTGGDICRLTVCHKDLVEFYNKNGIPELRKPGKPCEYTIETEGDDVYLVMDRPLDVPVIVDYIAYGYPKPVSSMKDEIEISAIAENLIFGLMREVYYFESSDYAFGEATASYLDNKAVREAIQELNKRWGNEERIVLGEG